MMKNTPILVFLFSLIFLSSVLSSVEVTKAKKDEEILLRQTYADMDKGIKNFVRENLKSVLRVLEEINQEFNISTKCKGNVFKLLSGIRDLKFWAVNFIDATGKLNDGILSGNIFMYGNYDQCMNATVMKRKGIVDFHGQYCLLSLATHLPKPELTPDVNDRAALVRNLTQNLTEAVRFFAYKSALFGTNLAKFGICVPSGCDTNDVDKLINYGSKQVLLNLTLDFCETEDTLIYFTPTRIIILCIYLLYILVVLIGSVIQRYSTVRKIQFKNSVMKTLICFSLPYNFEKFTDTKVTERNISFLNGIRVLTLFYVVLAHHWLLKLLLPSHRNSLSNLVSTWSSRFFFQIIINGAFTVDVFFFIGGFLNCYMRAKKSFTYFSFSSSFMIIIHRLIRIYPVYIFMILLSLLINLRGPMGQYIEALFWEPCKTQWWKNLIFINNFYPLKFQCIPHSWYLASDMQFFLVSLFTIPLLYRNQKIGVLVNLTIIFFSTSFTSVRVWAEKIMPTYVITEDIKPKDFEDMFDIHYLPFPHASAYFGGVLLGFFVTKKRKLIPSKITLVFGWLIATTMFLTMLFVSKRWGSGIPYTRLESALYFSLSKLLYSWSVGWLIFCCFIGKGGFINYILSWKVWIPLSRLGLSAYLLSATWQLCYFGNLRTVQDFQHEIEIWGYFGDLTVTCLSAVPMVLLFEFPFTALEKLIFHKKENNPELTKNNELKENGIFHRDIDEERNDDKS